MKIDEFKAMEKEAWAFKNVPAAEPVLPTDEELLKEILDHPLKPAVSQVLWPRVEFKYHLLPHEVAKELESATVMLLPTRADTSPNAVKEAVVAGLPVVASNVGGIPDYVFDGKNGLLFPPGDLPAFVHALRSACVHPLFRRGAVEPEALARARAYLSPELMAANFLKAYEAALAVCS